MKVLPKPKSEAGVNNPIAYPEVEERTQLWLCLSRMENDFSHRLTAR